MFDILSHPSIDLSGFLSVCRLLPSYCSSPSYLSWLLLSCLPVLTVTALPTCLECYCPAYLYSDTFDNGILKCKTETFCFVLDFTTKKSFFSNCTRVCKKELLVVSEKSSVTKHNKSVWTPKKFFSKKIFWFDPKVCFKNERIHFFGERKKENESFRFKNFAFLIQMRMRQGAYGTLYRYSKLTVLRGRVKVLTFL